MFICFVVKPEKISRFLFYLQQPMANWKDHIPGSVKLFIRLQQRYWRDVSTGNRRKFAKNTGAAAGFHEALSITQPVKMNPGAENKYQNLSLAIAHLHHLIIFPGEIFSFWQLVREPSEKKGYKKSRTIISGELAATTGGGLCQLSGIIYHLALSAGLTIIERHAHSLDIYTEAERFTPLGSDATVSFGYKDLRFKNDFHFPVALAFQLSPAALTASLSARGKLSPRHIEFSCNRLPGQTIVDTILYKDGAAIILNTHTYRHLAKA